MCRFYYVPCQTQQCEQNAQQYMESCVMKPNCQKYNIPQPFFCGERWCRDCIRDGTWFSWKHIETQIRALGIYQRWIAELGGENVRHLSLFAQLCALNLHPPALRYYDIRLGTTFYSLPIGLQEQDLTPRDKELICTLVILTEINSETMDKHRKEIANYTRKLRVFIIKSGLGKVFVM